MQRDKLPVAISIIEAQVYRNEHQRCPSRWECDRCARNKTTFFHSSGNHGNMSCSSSQNEAAELSISFLPNSHKIAIKCETKKMLFVQCTKPDVDNCFPIEGRLFQRSPFTSLSMFPIHKRFIVQGVFGVSDSSLLSVKFLGINRAAALIEMRALFI